MYYDDATGALAVGGLLVVTAAGIGYQALLGIMSMAATTALPVLGSDPAAAVATLSDVASSIVGNSTSTSVTATIGIPGGGDSAASAAAGALKETQETAALVAESGHGDEVTHYAALGVSAVSIIAKEALYHYSMYALTDV